MKRLRFKKRVYWLLAINILLLALLGCGCLRWHSLASRLDSQYAAERWGQEIKFAQVSCFLPIDSSLKEEDILSFRQKLDSALSAASVEPLAENGSLYTDAYAALGSLSLSGDHGSSNATAVAIGGDWFTFHPLRLLSGSYIQGGDLMADRVVLDRELAFNLFGSVEVAGMTVTINKRPYLVAGVVEREQDKFSQQANESAATVFVLLDSKLVTNPITCYELVMAEPLTGFTLAAVKDNFPLGSGQALQNSGRFQVNRIDDLLLDYAQRGVSRAGIAFPWWENAAKVTENHLTLLLAVLAPLPLLPLVCLVWLLVLLFRRVKATLARRKAAQDYQNQEQDPTLLAAELRELERRQLAASTGEPLPELLTWEELEETLAAEEAAEAEAAAEAATEVAAEAATEAAAKAEAATSGAGETAALDVEQMKAALAEADADEKTLEQLEPEAAPEKIQAEAAPAQREADAPVDTTETEAASGTEAAPDAASPAADIAPAAYTPTEAPAEEPAQKQEPESLAEARVAAVLRRYLHHEDAAPVAEQKKRKH